MDLATLIGMLGAMTAVILAIWMGGDFAIFYDLTSIIIVFAGTLLIVLIKFPLASALSALHVGMKAFVHKSQKPSDIISQTVDLANIARREGLLGLERIEVENEFLRKGVELLVDGHDQEFVRKLLSKDINLTIERNEDGVNIFRAIGDVAPAMGMIGTLIGLVQMMSNMNDPKTLGPAMAVAILTTFYGAILANVIALPIADKLKHRIKEERLNKSMILEGVAAIQDGMNPRIIEGLLETYLDARDRHSTNKEAA